MQRKGVAAAIRRTSFESRQVRIPPPWHFLPGAGAYFVYAHTVADVWLSHTGGRLGPRQNSKLEKQLM
jgi:hypothetical protein